MPRFVLGSKAPEIDRFNSSIEELDALFGGASYVVQDEEALAQQKTAQAPGEFNEKPGDVTSRISGLSKCL